MSKWDDVRVALDALDRGEPVPNVNRHKVMRLVEQLLNCAVKCERRDMVIESVDENVWREWWTVVRLGRGVDHGYR